MVLVLLSMCLGLTACGLGFTPMPFTAADTMDHFVMPDGTRLPYRAWMPSGPPQTVILALHGMNDSRDAWEIPAPAFAAAGIAVIAPDQRGFGATETRGHWPGTSVLVDDARVMARLLHVQYPHAKLFLMGESMGAAVLMTLATSPDPPEVEGYILSAPAVWGRAEMNVFMRLGLWAVSRVLPSLIVENRGYVKVTASDNRAALVRLSNDPLTIHGTRADSIRGLVDLMDSALAAASSFRAHALFIYGGKDELVPERATRATWTVLPPSAARLAFYPGHYHLAMRDKDRTTVIDDVIAWIRRPAAPLPSGGDHAAAHWLAGPPR